MPRSCGQTADKATARFPLFWGGDRASGPRHAVLQAVLNEPGHCPNRRPNKHLFNMFRYVQPSLQHVWEPGFVIGHKKCTVGTFWPHGIKGACRALSGTSAASRTLKVCDTWTSAVLFQWRHQPVEENRQTVHPCSAWVGDDYGPWPQPLCSLVYYFCWRLVSLASETLRPWDGREKGC